MTPEDQRIALAEIEGYIHYGCTGCAHTPCLCKGYLTPAPDHDLVYDLPDYLNDLNAVHKVEIWLSRNPNGDGGSRLPWYRHHLEEVCDRTGGKLTCVPVHAAASQRCEAILRALNKWEE